MALLGIKVPYETARLLAQVDVPGKRESVGDFHITLLYLGDGTPLEQLETLVGAVYAVTSRTKPFTVQTSQVTTFPHGSDGTPVIARIEGEPLHALRAELKASILKAGIPFEDTYPEYKPHVTLAYSPDPLAGEVAEKGIPLVEWGIGEVVLWGGDNMTDRLQMSFPFSMSKTAFYRGMARLAMSSHKACDCGGSCPCQAKKVATRYARDFPTQKALEEYLHDHPGADKSKHHVEDGDEDEGVWEKAKGWLGLPTKREKAEMAERADAEKAKLKGRKAPETHIRDEKPEKLRERVKSLAKDLTDEGQADFTGAFMKKLDKGEKLTEKEWQRLDGALNVRKLAARVAARYVEAVRVTDLNLYTLASEIERQGLPLKRFEPTSTNGIRRCIDGGLLEQTGEKVGRGFAWKLTELGEKILKEWYAKNPHHNPNAPKNDNMREYRR